MKKVLCLILCLITVFSLSGCRIIDRSDEHRDYEGYIQFIVEFNTGLFAYTNTDSDLAYSPSNPKLKKKFTYGAQGVKFSAEYEEDRIVYTVVNPSGDGIAEEKTFDDIYGIYLENWSYFCNETEVGSVSPESEEEPLTINMYISGYAYTVSFFPRADTPQIIYEKSEAL